MSHAQKSKSSENHEADQSKRKFLRDSLILGAAALSLSALPLVERLFPPAPPATQRSNDTLSKTQIYSLLNSIQKESAEFMKLFSGGPKSYEEAVKFIEGVTGIKVERHDYGCDSVLTRTRRFYQFANIYNIVPKSSTVYVALHESESNGIYYDTFNATANDGRIKALADYVLSRYPIRIDDLRTELCLSAFIISSWACKNLRTPTTENAAKGYDALRKQLDREEGKTHSFHNAIDILQHDTGICYDYANLASDLLNAVGIPARPITIYLFGSTQESYTNDFRGHNFAHAVVQVFGTESPFCLDPTNFWVYTSDVNQSIYYDLAKDSIGMFLDMYKDLKTSDIYTVLMTGAMPEEHMPKKLADFLLAHPYGTWTGKNDHEALSLWRPFIDSHRKEYLVLRVSKYDLANPNYY